MERKKKLALFIGSDISSHLLINELIEVLIKQNFQPYVYFTEHYSRVRQILPEVQTLQFFERKVLQGYIYPFLDNQPVPKGAICLSPKHMSEVKGVIVKRIKDVNDPKLIEKLEKQGIEIGIVIRCYQKFGKKIIDYFNRGNHRALWNLHPGILPYYRGVMTYFRSMNDLQLKAGYSLHIIDNNWDSGPIIDSRPQYLDLSKSMLANYCHIASSGVPIIIDNLKKLVNDGCITTLKQNKKLQDYHTFPTRLELDEFIKKGLSLVNINEMNSIYLRSFSIYGTKHYSKLSEIIDNAIIENTNSNLIQAPFYDIKGGNIIHLNKTK